MSFLNCLTESNSFPSLNTPLLPIIYLWSCVAERETFVWVVSSATTVCLYNFYHLMQKLTWDTPDRNDRSKGDWIQSNLGSTSTSKLQLQNPLHPDVIQVLSWYAWASSICSLDPNPGNCPISCPSSGWNSLCKPTANSSGRAPPLWK